MATSALKASTAPDPSVLGESASTSDYASKYKEVQDAQQKLIELLNRRSQPAYDPGLLAIAGEMLDPGKTGSFGEAVGRAAKAYAPVQEAQSKRLEENALMRMQLSQMGLEQARKGEAMRRMSGITGEGPSNTPKPTETPVSRAEDVTSSPAPTPGVVAAPAAPSGPAVKVRGKMITPAQIRDMTLLDPEMGKALAEEYKMNLEAITTQPGGAYNKLTGEFTPFGGAPAIAEVVPEVGGTLMMAPEDAMSLRNARKTGDAKTAYSIIDRYQKGVGPRPGVLPVPGEQSSAPTPPAPAAGSTVEEREVGKAGQLERAKLTAKAETERTQDIMKDAAAAPGIRQNARTLTTLASKPGMENVLGVFEHPTIVGMLGSAIEQGTGRLDMPAIREITAKANTLLNVPQGANESNAAYQARKQEIMDNMAMLTQAFAQTRWATTRLMAKGLGQVSNYENKSLAELSSSAHDTVPVILKKAALQEINADKTEQMGEALSRTGMTLEQYKRTPEYKKLELETDKRVQSVIDPEGYKAGRSPYEASALKQTSRPMSLTSSSIADELKRRNLK